jgi:hypothetical protein
MKPKLHTLYLVSCIFYLLTLCPLPSALGQVPQGFNYQAVAKSLTGGVITNATLQVKISFLSDTITPVIVYEELHSSVKTNMSGVFNIVIGNGVWQAGSAAKFSDINWAEKPLYLKTQVYYNNAWKYMGTSRLWSVPYSMVTANMLGAVTKMDIRGTDTSPDSAIFIVKNKDGQIVFAVYNEGVRVYVDDGVAKSPKGGFAIGGFGTAKGVSQNYLTVTSDSVRVYVNENPTKSSKGGFAIGGFGTTKQSSESFLQLTPKNYFIGHNSGKNITTGLYNSFLGYMSGYKTTEGLANTFFGDSTGFNNTTGSWNVFVGKNAGLSNETSVSNVFIGNGAGELAKHSAENTGSYNVAIGTLAGYYNNGRFNVFLGQEAGFYNEKGKQNIFIGMGAGYYNDTASFNVAIGTDAGYNNMGKAGVFIGNFAGYDNLGDYNVLIGNNAGQAITTGEKNVILGSDAGYDNTTGTYNTFLGNLSGSSNISGNYNLYAGSEAGYANTTGEYNVFLGNYAGASATGSYNTVAGNAAGKVISANYNTMMGFQTGYSTTSGVGNAFFGHQAGHGNISGQYNTSIGPLSGYTNTTGSNNVFIGKWAGYNETGSDKLYIDNAGNNSSAALIYGDFANHQLRFNAYLGINSTPDSYYRLYISGAGYATVGWYYPSDIRLKQNIRSLDGDGVIDKVRDMGVIMYNYKDEVIKGHEDPQTKYIGVIAQDIEKSFPEAVRTDENGYKAVSLNALTAILLQAVKDQQKQIDELKKEVEELKSQK